MSRLLRAAKGGIDWDAGRAHLARAAEALEETLSPSPSRSRRIMDERARRLAVVPPEPRRARQSLAAIFSLVGGRYAIATDFVREIIRPGRIETVPGAPRFLHGVANFRGEILALVDLRPLLGLGTDAPAPTNYAIVLGADDAEFAILADAVEAIAGFAEEALHDPHAAHDGTPDAIVRGIAPDGLIVLDGAAILADQRLFIDQTEATGSSPAMQVSDQ